ncbi:MAG: alpha/beta hydrolase [Gemmatimonadota bacterium]
MKPLYEFKIAQIDTGQASIFVCSSGSGPPILLFHGFPETHLMWRDVAPLLTQDCSVICPDLRGYGRSSCPASASDHARYSKRALAQDMVLVMKQLGFDRFAVVGHDRGGRVACRMALDHPCVVERLAVLDVVPTESVWNRADAGSPSTSGPGRCSRSPHPCPRECSRHVPRRSSMIPWEDGALPRTCFPRKFAPLMLRHSRPRGMPMRSVKNIGGGHDRPGARQGGS